MRALLNLGVLLSTLIANMTAISRSSKLSNDCGNPTKTSPILDLKLRKSREGFNFRMLFGGCNNKLIVPSFNT